MMFNFIFYGKSERGFRSLKSIYEHGYVPSFVFLEKYDDNFVKWLRGNKLDFSICPTPKDLDHLQQVGVIKPDVLVCAGYSRIFPQSLISSANWGVINCHGGRLPNYRGASPIPWQIINGESHGCAYVLKMTEGIDNGPILAEREYEISPSDTARAVTDKVLDIFSDILPSVMDQIAELRDIPKGVSQNEFGAVRWGRRYPEDGKIDWSQPVTQVYNLIRALDHPYPGAYLEFENMRIKIWRASTPNQIIRGVPGRVVGKTSSSTLVLCGDGVIQIDNIEIAGERQTGNFLPFGYGFLLR